MNARRVNLVPCAGELGVGLLLIALTSSTFRKAA